MKSTPFAQSQPSRPARRLIALVASVLLLAPLLAGGFLAPAQASILGKPTVVSLTFDDGNANQLNAGAILNRYGLKGTFFIASGFLDQPGYLTRANLNTLKAQGHEIGGHTVTHPDLTTLPTDEVARQVCNDRAALMGMGHAVRSFAYPFASVNASVEDVVRTCGYNSGRSLGDLKSPRDPDCRDCPPAAALPPANPYETEALSQVESNWTLGDLKDAVQAAEKKGGWVQFTFHNVCETRDRCELNVTPSTLKSFSLWLSLRPLLYKTTVKTVGDVVGGPVAPVNTSAMPQPMAPGVNGMVNPGMEQIGADGAPTCWSKGGHGTNTSTLSVTQPGRTGLNAGQVTVSQYTNGDAKWLPTFDLGGCAPTVAAGHTYSLRQWYTSTAVTQFAVYLRNSSGRWSYWTSSPWFPSSASYTQAVWETPAIPAGMTGISFGLSAFNQGTLTTDDASIYDTVGAPDPAADVAAVRTAAKVAITPVDVPPAPSTVAH